MTVAVIFGAMLMLAGLILFMLYLVVHTADKSNKKPVAHRHWE